MPRVLIIHRDPAEAAALAVRPSREGFETTAYSHRGTSGFRYIRENPPDAIIIDLTSLPSYGKAIGALLREHKGTRMIPLVFIEGDPEKMEPVRELFPDAVFTTWPRIGPALRKATRHPVENPAVPEPWSVPLPQKLRIREGSVVALRYAPEGFAQTLGTLPKGARLVAETRDADVILVFVKSIAALGREMKWIAREMRKGLTLWLIWPKKAAATGSDLTMPRIHEMCLPLGLVGYKTCAVDETWSGMVIARRSRVI